MVYILTQKSFSLTVLLLQVSPIDELTELFSRSSVRTAPGGMTMAPNPGNPQAGTLGALNQNVLYAASGMNNVASLTHGSRASTPSFGHSPYPLGTASANGAANGIKTTHHQHQPPQQQQQQQQQNQYPLWVQVCVCVCVCVHVLASFKMYDLLVFRRFTIRVLDIRIRQK